MVELILGFISPDDHIQIFWGATVQRITLSPARTGGVFFRIDAVVFELEKRTRCLEHDTTRTVSRGFSAWLGSGSELELEEALELVSLEVWQTQRLFDVGFWQPSRGDVP